MGFYPLRECCQGPNQRFLSGVRPKAISSRIVSIVRTLSIADLSLGPRSRFWHLPANGSAHGVALDQHLLLNLWILLALAALAHAILLTGLAILRAPEAKADQHHRTWIEYIPLACVTVLFAALALRAERLWAQTRYTGASPAALQVEATGVQFAWYFRYPGIDATFGRIDPTLIEPGAGNPLGLDPADRHGADDLVRSELVLPAGREVDLTLRAQDVIHGFAIPELRVKQNAVPGHPLHIHFTPMVAGAYAILCTQLCGLGHYRMNAQLRVLSPAAYAEWSTAQLRSTPEARVNP